MKGTQSWMSPLCSNEEEPTSEIFRHRATKNFLLQHIQLFIIQVSIHSSISQLGYTKRRPPKQTKL